jgi:hypothetical protein
VQRACKLLPPWPIKRGAAPQPQETDTGRRTATAHTLSAFPTILALASITTLGLGGHTFSPASLVATPLRAHGASNTVPRAHHCWTYDPGRNQDKPSVPSCLAPAIERQISALITS